MIITNLDEYKYNFLPSPILEALEEAIPLFEHSMPKDGVYPLKNNAMAFVMTYTTKNEDEIVYESHKEMTDIQILLEGEEYFYTTEKSSLTINMNSYKENLTKDLIFYNEKPKDIARAHLKKGTFTIIYPPIAHAPAIMVDSPKEVRKLVIKVPFK